MCRSAAAAAPLFVECNKQQIPISPKIARHSISLLLLLLPLPFDVVVLNAEEKETAETKITFPIYFFIISNSFLNLFINMHTRQSIICHFNIRCF